MKNLWVINGPNLNLLGSREQKHYGKFSLEELVHRVGNYGREKDFKINHFQSNIEGELINKIHELRTSVAGLIVNMGGYSHTSVALYDALLLVEAPIVEVHLSQLYQREDFRQTFLTAKAAEFVVSGGGTLAYECAIDYLEKRFK